MQKISVDETNYLVFRPTPWDSKIFGFNTNEILEIHYDDIEKLPALVALFDSHNVREGIKFTYTRIDVGDKALRGVLNKSGFYYAETSLSMKNNKVLTGNYGAIFRNHLELTVPEEADFEHIKIIARDSFSYGRFHEDVSFDEERASARYYNWIDDLRRQSKKFLVYKSNNIVISFLAYEAVDNCVMLVLAGSMREHGLLTPYFWASFMTYFQNKGYKRAHALVSASNIAIINVYVKLNFLVEKALLGFHKRY